MTFCESDIGLEEIAQNCGATAVCAFIRNEVDRGVTKVHLETI
jgi:hypothetical protein